MEGHRRKHTASDTPSKAIPTHTGNTMPVDHSSGDAPGGRWRPIFWMILLLLAGMLLGITNTPFGRDQVRSVIEHQASTLLSDARLDIGHLDGNLFTALEANDIRLVSSSGHELLALEQLRVRYRPWALLRSELFLDALHLEGLRARGVQQADSSWDWDGLLAPSEGGSEWTVRIDTISTRRIMAEAVFQNPSRDSTLYVHALDLRASGLWLTPDTDVRVREVVLESAFQPPMRPDTVQMALRAHYAEGRVVLDTLDLHSDRSQVAAAGIIDGASFPSFAFHPPVVSPPTSGMTSPAEATTFSIRAAPLALSDVAPFFPGLQARSEVRATLDMTQRSAGIGFHATVSHSGGGMVSASVEWDEAESGTQVRADVEARGFDLDHILGRGLATSPVDASVNVALQGPASDSLSGRIALHTTAMVMNGFTMGPTHLELAAHQGHAEAAVESLVMESLWRARLSGRWLDAEPDVVLEGTIENFDLAPWMDASTLSSRITASFSGSSQGLDPSTMVSRLAVSIQPSRVGTTDTITGGVDLDVRDGDVSWSALFRIADGSLRSRGEVALSEPPQLYPSTLRIDSVDVAALLQDAGADRPATRVSAALTAEGDLEDWRFGKGRLQLQTDATEWGAYRLAGSKTEATWDAGRGSIAMAFLPTDTSSITVDLALRAEDNKTHLQSRNLAWRDVDLQTMTVFALPDARLHGNGRLRMTLEGSRLQHMDLSLQAEPSQWGLQEVRSFDLTLEADAQIMEAALHGSFRGPDGREPSPWLLQATLDQWNSDASALRADMYFEALDPTALAGRSDAGTALSGRARATATLKSKLPPAADFEVDLSSSQLRGEPVSRARMTGLLQDSVLTADAAFSVAEGRFDAQVTARPFDDVPSFSSAGSIAGLNVLPLLGRADLDSDVNLRWEVSRTAHERTSATWHLDIQGAPSRLDSLLIEDLDMSASWDGRVLDIDHLSSLSNTGNLLVKGRLNLSPESSEAYSDFRATWQIGNLRSVKRLAGRERLTSSGGTVDLQVYGLPGQLDAELLLSLSELEVDDVMVSSIETSAWTALDNAFVPLSTTATVDIGYTALPTLAIPVSSLQIDQRGQTVALKAHAMIDAGNKLTLSGQFNPFSAGLKASVHQFDLMLGGAPFVLERPVTLVVEDGWQMSPLALTADEQSMALAGEWSDAAGLAVRVDLASIDLAPIGVLAGLPDLEGRVGGRLLLSGEVEAPRIDTHVEAELRDDGEALALLRSTVQSTSDGLRLDAALSTPDSGDITVAGFLPLFARFDEKGRERADRNADLNLTLRTEGASIRWLNPLLDPTVMTDLEGVASMDIRVGGTIDDPQLAGFLNVDGARFRLPEYGVTYRMDRFRSTLDGVSLTFDEARLRSGGGSMDVSGQIDFASLTNSSFAMRAQLDRFRAVRNDELQTALSGALELTGRTTRPELRGRLTTSNTSFWLTEAAGGDLRQFPLSFDDEIMLAENFGYRTVIADTLADAIWKGLSMDLAIEIERDTWIRQRVNPEMAIQLSGRVDLQKDRGQEDLNIFRSIEVIPDRSTIKQFGRNFRIVEGVAQFNGPVDDLVLQVEAEYEVPSRLNPGQPEVVVTLRLDGRLDDLAFNLSSDPALDNTDIVSYIATGRPASESLQFSDAGMNNQVLVGVAASQLAGLVEGVASQSLGLDVVSIEQDGLKGTRLTAGKYITPRLFVGVTQPFSFSGGSSIVVDEQRELTVEYEVLSYLLLQLLADASDSPVRLNLAGRYSY